MGTTLTGTTPQDTYDSLIKVTDNGPLSGTAKYLSDGLGNDSALAVSTSKVGIGTASPTGKLTVSSGAAGGGYNSDYDELVLTNAGRVGINILSSATEFGAIIMGGKADNTTGGIYHNASTNMLSLATQDTFRLNIDNAGNVGIGTSTPSGILSFKDVYQSTFYRNANFGTSLLLSADAGSDQRTWQFASRNQSTRVDLAVLRSTNGTTYGSSPTGLTYAEMARFTENGLTFNGDTAAANALDDYEEGTFTCTVNIASGSVTADTTVNQGRYTKIGNVVSVQGRMKLTAVSSPSGNWSISLPFAAVSYNANGANEGIGPCIAADIDFGTNTMISATPDRGTALCFFISSGDNSAKLQLNGTHLSATSDLYFQTTYITA